MLTLPIILTRHSSTHRDSRTCENIEQEEKKEKEGQYMSQSIRHHPYVSRRVFSELRFIISSSASSSLPRFLFASYFHLQSQISVLKLSNMSAPATSGSHLRSTISDYLQLSLKCDAFTKRPFLAQSVDTLLFPRVCRCLRPDSIVRRNSPSSLFAMAPSVIHEWLLSCLGAFYLFVNANDLTSFLSVSVSFCFFLVHIGMRFYVCVCICINYD